MSGARYLNTPRLVEDATQKVVWRWDQQEPFGDSVADENPSAQGTFDLPLRLPGQYFDSETDLSYNYFRDYDPSLGRYERSDPLGLSGGTNTYAYAAANALWAKDRLGLAAGSGILTSLFNFITRQVESEPASAGAELGGAVGTKSFAEQGTNIGVALCKGGTRDYVTDCLDKCIELIPTDGRPSGGGGPDVSECTGNCQKAYVQCKYKPTSSCPVSPTS